MYERLLEQTISPSMEDLARHCGKLHDAYLAFNNALAAQFQTTAEIRFPYGKRYGWCVTHRRKKKLVCDVFVEVDAFTVMLRLSDRQFAAPYGALRPETQALIDRRYPCGDGGWIHYRVAYEDDLADIMALLCEKCQ